MNWIHHERKRCWISSTFGSHWRSRQFELSCQPAPWWRRRTRWRLHVLLALFSSGAPSSYTRILQPTKNFIIQRLITSTIMLNLLHVFRMVIMYDQAKIESGSLITLLVSLLVFILPGVFMVILISKLFFDQGGGTPSPAPKTMKTQHLVIEGPYGYTRNPMVSGEVWLLVGLSLVFHSTRLFLFTIGFVPLGSAFFVYYEEPDLRSRFGNEYIVYCQNVPRWIPRRTPYVPVTSRSD